jgi:ABC-type bacteriocin/lantibiotic exporter with double-glycine peptidase domain
VSADGRNAVAASVRRCLLETAGPPADAGNLGLLRADEDHCAAVIAMRRWRKPSWALPRNQAAQSLVRQGIPPGFFGFVWRVSARSQLWASLLAIAVFTLNTAPLEMQRRILNAAVLDGDVMLVVMLAAAYAAIVLSEGLVKTLMNIYRGWVGEKAVRAMRLAASGLVDSMSPANVSATTRGVEVPLILGEPEPIGAFVGIVISDLVLNVGILLSVFGYMFFMQPLLAMVSLALFLPQLVFGPLMQRAINRRVRSRIAVLRQASVGVLLSGGHDLERALKQELRFAEIFQLNMGIIKLRYSMKFPMNLTHNLGKVIVLGVGEWYVINGQAEVGTVVAFASGLNNVRDPWGDLVEWYQDMMQAHTKYGIFAAAMDRFSRGQDPLSVP